MQLFGGPLYAKVIGQSSRSHEETTLANAVHMVNAQTSDG